SGYLGGSGGVVSNAADLARYLATLLGGGAAGDRLVSPSALESMFTPPTGSDYAMGWFERERDGTRLLEHNGILSTYTAQAVLLPDEGYGVAVLYDVHSLAQDLLAFPRFEQGLVSLLVGEEPAPGWFDVRHWGLVFAALTLLGAALGVRALIRFPAWTASAPDVGTWRHLVGMVLSLLPLTLVLAMPAIVLRTSGRYFGFLTLFRSMIGVMTWLSVVGVLGAANAALRLKWLLRRA
ncbi:MAG TPA: serine hydrolase, partial [Trueperaceae bacterium]